MSIMDTFENFFGIQTQEWHCGISIVRLLNGCIPLHPTGVAFPTSPIRGIVHISNFGHLIMSHFNLYFLITSKFEHFFIF